MEQIYAAHRSPIIDPVQDQLPPSERASKMPVLLLSFTRAIVDSLRAILSSFPSLLLGFLVLSADGSGRGVGS